MLPREVEWVRTLGIEVLLRRVLDQKVEPDQAARTLLRKLEARGFDVSDKTRKKIEAAIEAAYFQDIRSLNDLTGRLIECLDGLPETQLAGCR